MSPSVTLQGDPGGTAMIFASTHGDGKRYVRIDVGGGSLSIILTAEQSSQLAEVLLDHPPFEGTPV